MVDAILLGDCDIVGTAIQLKKKNQWEDQDIGKWTVMWFKINTGMHRP